MPRIRTLGKCDRNTWFDKIRGVDMPEPHRMFCRGREELRTMKGKVLDFERSNVSQTLVPFISHDIRHHLASIYCNAEFMSDPDICQTDREQFLAEVRGTDLRCFLIYGVS